MLKLWAAWLHHGDAGYARRIEHACSLVQHAIDHIQTSRDLTLCHTPESLNVCFRVAGCSSAAISEALHAQGLAMVGTGMVGGQQTVRLVIVDPAMSTADVDAFFAAVRTAASDYSVDTR